MDAPPLRVLLIEDDEDDFVLVRDLLSEISQSGYALDWVQTYHDALDAIESRCYDVYLLDYRLGEYDGLTLLREAKQRGCRAPIIFLTGQGNYDIDVAAMRAGAADYLVKGQINAPLLERSIRYAIDRQRAAEALRKSEQQYRMLVETMNEGLGVQDSRGTITYVNDKLCDMLGFTREELIGRPITDLLDAGGQVRLQEEIAKPFMSDRVHFEIDLLRKNGTRLPTIISSSPIFDEDGTFKGGIATVTDISTLKRAEQIIQESRQS